MSDDRFALWGRTPARVVAPRSLADVQDEVRRAQGRAIVPWGGGTRQHVGYAPVRYDVALSTENLDAVTDYQPADLTVTAQAGVTLARLQTVLAEHGQWLPLDVARPEQQTIGGIVAARAGSLRRLGWGSVRDSLLGVSVVNAEGEVVKGGGKVVKNVAGYDLPKLYCGSWGTLGVITEATFKVAPLPEASATVLLPLDADRNSEDVLDALLSSALEPSFLVLLSPAAALDVLEGGLTAQHIVIGFDGLMEAVTWQLETVGHSEGVLTDEASTVVRQRLRDYAHRPAPFTAVFHILSSQVGAYSRMMEWTARRAGFGARVVSDAALGLVWAHFEPLPGEADWGAFYADLADKAARVGGSFIAERMPEELRACDTPVWSPLLADFPLMKRLKERLDPTRMWNPGRFVGRL